MSRLIDAEALHTLFDEKCVGECEACTYYEDCKGHRYCGLIDLAPTVEERPHGEWGLINVVAMPYLVAYSCPFCKEWGNIQTFKPNFCPNCGADMRGENNESIQM